jgi:hypothetical protein
MDCVCVSCLRPSGRRVAPQAPTFRCRVAACLGRVFVLSIPVSNRAKWLGKPSAIGLVGGQLRVRGRGSRVVFLLSRLAVLCLRYPY